jgi:hypothetical protein
MVSSNSSFVILVLFLLFFITTSTVVGDNGPLQNATYWIHFKRSAVVQFFTSFGIKNALPAF